MAGAADQRWRDCYSRQSHHHKHHLQYDRLALYARDARHASFEPESRTRCADRFLGFDLKHFYEYLDTIENAVFSSAELVLNNTSTHPPRNVQLRVLDKSNHFRNGYYDTLFNSIVQPVADRYLQKIAPVITIGPAISPTVDINTDRGVVLPVYADTYQLPEVYITNFCQYLYQFKKDPRRITSFCLMPEPNEFKKSTNSLIFDKGVVLRVYYSVPVIKIQ